MFHRPGPGSDAGPSTRPLPRVSGRQFSPCQGGGLPAGERPEERVTPNTGRGRDEDSRRTPHVRMAGDSARRPGDAEPHPHGAERTPGLARALRTPRPCTPGPASAWEPQPQGGVGWEEGSGH